MKNKFFSSPNYKKRSFGYIPRYFLSTEQKIIGNKFIERDFAKSYLNKKKLISKNSTDLENFGYSKFRNTYSPFSKEKLPGNIKFLLLYLLVLSVFVLIILYYLNQIIH